MKQNMNAQVYEACPCQAQCGRHGHCVSCIAHHIQYTDLTNCQKQVAAKLAKEGRLAEVLAKVSVPESLKNMGEVPLGTEAFEACPCQANCQRHGSCVACITHHMSHPSMTSCMKLVAAKLASEGKLDAKLENVVITI